MNRFSKPYRPKSEADLSEREQEILRLVVRSFIDTAGPIGSRFLSKRYTLGLSAASIRNTMSDLEDLGYLDHPYTSAGRVPTRLGFRAFVDELMESPVLSTSEKKTLKAELERLVGRNEQLLRESTQLLGRLTNLLGVVLTPAMDEGVLERLEIVALSSTRAMFILSVQGGSIRTIVVEVESSLERSDLSYVVSMLNERLAGLTLAEVRRTCEDRLRDLDDRKTGLVQLIQQSSALLFNDEPVTKRVRIGSAQELVKQPEFRQPEALRNLMGLLESDDAIVQLLQEPLSEAVNRLGAAQVVIGREHEDAAARYSVVAAQYQMGAMRGTIGVIGPMRMDYARAVSLVEGMAALLTDVT